MIARQPGQETALDRVAGALSSEAARTELYRYASGLGEQLPADASTWYVVGAVLQVNAVTRHELTTLAAESKRGADILSGFFQVADQLPKVRRWTTVGAVLAIIAGSVLAGLAGWGGYSVGWSLSQNGIYETQEQVRCDTLLALRHDLVVARQTSGVALAERRLIASRCSLPRQRR